MYVLTNKHCIEMWINNSHIYPKNQGVSIEDKDKYVYRQEKPFNVQTPVKIIEILLVSTDE